MSRNTYLPSTDAGLLAWATNLRDRLGASPATYNLDTATIDAFEALMDVYSARLAEAVNPITSTRGKVAAKNDAREALKKSARLLAFHLYGQGLTDEQIINLGLTVKDREPTASEAPSQSPTMKLVSVRGNIVSIKMSDSVVESNRGRPEGVAGATVLAHVGESAPASILDWKFATNTTRLSVDVPFDPSLAPGTKVWITAFWRGPRDQSGPAADPIVTALGMGLSQVA